MYFARSYPFTDLVISCPDGDILLLLMYYLSICACRANDAIGPEKCQALLGIMGSVVISGEFHGFLRV